MAFPDYILNIFRVNLCCIEDVVDLGVWDVQSGELADEDDRTWGCGRQDYGYSFVESVQDGSVGT